MRFVQQVATEMRNGGMREMPRDEKVGRVGPQERNDDNKKGREYSVGGGECL